MAADFKSHVLRRDEKGVFGIPFKRLLLAGVGGGLVYSIVHIAHHDISLPFAIVSGITLLILTGTRGGLTLWQRWVYRLRGILLLLGAEHPRGIAAQIVRTLELPLELVRLEGTRVFTPPNANLDFDLREWITFAAAHDADADTGLVFVDSPMQKED